jgi:uncharacterized membrane protein
MVPSVILGVLLLTAGIVFRYARIKRNYFLGYRTFRSMKNDANWDFANKEMAKYSLTIGLLSTISGLLFWYLGIAPKHIIYPTLGLIFISIVIVEIRLKRFEDRQKM